MYQQLFKKFCINHNISNFKSFNNSEHLELLVDVQSAYWHLIDVIDPKCLMSFADFIACWILEYPAYSFGYESPAKLVADFTLYQKCKPVANGILIDDDCKSILLVKRLNGVWLFPGGKLDKGESASSAAVREVYEEVGLDVGDLLDEKQQFTITVNKKESTNFVIFGVDSSLPVLFAQKELLDAKWISIEHLMNAARKGIYSRELRQLGFNNFTIQLLKPCMTPISMAINIKKYKH